MSVLPVYRGTNEDQFFAAKVPEGVISFKNSFCRGVTIVKRKGGGQEMHTEQEQRHVYYDHDLEIEAYNLSGIVQKFPNHFHDYYVIGFVEGGKRHLWCKGLEYDLTAGDLILFNPRDNHFCAPINGEILDYRAVNINMDVMQSAVREITGKDFIPHFTRNVVYQSDITQSIGDLYDAILTHAPKLKKE